MSSKDDNKNINPTVLIVIIAVGSIVMGYVAYKFISSQLSDLPKFRANRFG